MPSSFFTPPATHLDPALFNGMELKEEVRLPLIRAAVTFLHKKGLKNPQSWLRLWLAGSAISYQWQADRGNGDLDVMVGIDYEQFLQDNPDYHWAGIDQMQNKINDAFRNELWPAMENANIGGKHFEVTYFWNRDIFTDIHLINPYAAYDLMRDKWIIQPPELPPNPKELYPRNWYEASANDEVAAKSLHDQYTASRQFSRDNPKTASYINAQARENLIRAQARSLYDDIHSGRRQAFSPGGKGYYDYYNFRWQSAKAGITTAYLKAILEDEQPTGIKPADEALEEAMNLRLGTRYDAR